MESISNKNYSVAQKETPYSGQYPAIPEFKKPWETTIQFGQGRAAISTQDTPLQSEGFSLCTAFILQNEDGFESCGAHIDEWCLNDKQLEIVKTLPSGKYIGRFIRGSISRDLRSIIMNPSIALFPSVFSEGRDLKILNDIVVDTGNYHWALVYKPNSRLLMVQSKLTQTVKEFDFNR